MKNPLKKNYSDVTVGENTEVNEEETEMEKVSFFARHKKGLLIGAGAALAGIAGLVIANRRSDDDFEDYDDEDLDDDSDSTEVSNTDD